MKPLAFALPYSWIFWVVFLAVYLPEFSLIARTRPAQPTKADRGSVQVIAIAGWLGMMGAFLVAAIPTFMIPSGQKTMFIAGLVCMVAGSLLRRHCWRMLGKHFTGDVRAAEDQPVIEDGAYRWVRHPSYTGGMLMYMGTAMALDNWLSILIIAVTCGAAYLYRVKVEEEALQAHLGGRYQQYMARTKRFVPFLF